MRSIARRAFEPAIARQVINSPVGRSGKPIQGGLNPRFVTKALLTVYKAKTRDEANPLIIHAAAGNAYFIGKPQVASPPSAVMVGKRGFSTQFSTGSVDSGGFLSDYEVASECWRAGSRL
jgi:hypothetical protein